MDGASILELFDQNKSKLEAKKRLEKRSKCLLYCANVYLLVGALTILSIYVWSFFAKQSLIKLSKEGKVESIERSALSTDFV